MKPEAKNERMNETFNERYIQAVSVFSTVMKFVLFIVCGWSRIFRGVGHQLPRGCGNLLFCNFFGQKLRENERIWTKGRGGTLPWYPLGSTTDWHQNNEKKMGLSLILYVIHTIFMGTMLNFKGPFTPSEIGNESETFLWCLSFSLWYFSLSPPPSFGVNEALQWY